MMESSSSYTSLKDLLPVSPPAAKSPTLNSSSWHEIPIKNHLVKQAALAYLQSAYSVPEAKRKDLFGRLKDAVAGEECGCVVWLNEVVFKPFRDLFSVRRRGGGGGGGDEIGDFDEGAGDEKFEKVKES